ncbi:MAG: DUF1566 domain-containing protein [Poseidonibacter sp.]
MKKIIIILTFTLLSLFAKSEFVRDNQTVIDKKLNLQWQDNIQSEQTKLSLNDSIKHCKNLSLAGYKDWRLATYEELLSLGDYEVYKPTINSIFKFTASGHYWTILYKTTQLGEHITLKDSTEVKRIYFSDGFSYDNDRTGKAYVRCVRNMIKD